MLIHAALPLFAWGQLEDCPTLSTLRDFLHTVPDQPLPPIPRATQEFERLYKGRTAVERVNARLKIFWGADDGNVAGARRFHALEGTVMIVHLVLATLLAQAPRWEGTLGQTRLGPVAEALHQAAVA